MIDLSTFKILYNYVLVKPDEDFETYQIKGKELGLIAPSFKYEGTGENQKRISVKERNVAVTGTVYQVPKLLQFNLDQIKALKSRYTTHKVIGGQLRMVNLPIQFEIDQLTKSSVQFNVPMEVVVGDKVNFSYMAHKQALEQGLVIDTEFGEMYLMKYDMLYMTVGENNEPKKMLNGWVLVEPDEIEVLNENGKEFVATSTEIVLLAPKSKLRKSKKNQLGTVKNAGTLCKGYLQQPDKSDGTNKIKNGDKLLYDPRMATKLEYETHQIYSDKIHHLVQRKDVWLIFDRDFDLDTISFDRRRRA